MNSKDAGRSLMLSCDDRVYPEVLRNIKDCPKSIYLRGDTSLLEVPGIAIVGSRRCSEYGKNVAMNVAKACVVNGFSVISGMAIGIDNFAHQGALKAGGKTIAVLGCGTDICYPRQHQKLYESILDRGLIVSELPDGTEAMPYNFPMRNRIIAGLAEAVVVIEARTGSGSLITAERAVDMGRPVFAVPGNITSQYSLGTNKLIADGAQALSVIDDLFYYLGVSPEATEDELEGLGDDERKVYELVKSTGETPQDIICMRLGMDPLTVSGIVAVLEIKGFVDHSMGKVIPVKL